MPRRSKINFRKSDQVRLSRAVQQFNSKITRVGKKQPAISGHQPERLNVADLKSKITTRADYNKILKMINRYLTKGAETVVKNKSGTYMTKFAKKEAQINLGVVNRRKAKDRKIVGDARKSGTMGTIEQWEAQPVKNIIETASKSEFENFYRNLQNWAMPSYTQNREEKYVENYIKALYTSMGESTITRQLAEMIKELDVNTFIWAANTLPALDIDFVYDDNQELELRYDLIYETLLNL